jgi:FKBP-type peptidyl-prolyl cis-trans isomerase
VHQNAQPVAAVVAQARLAAPLDASVLVVSKRMLPSRRYVATATTFLAALSIAPLASSQPIEPLQRARPVAPPPPRDVAEAPAQATKTASGLAWKMLSKGQGGAHPGPHDKVSVTFTGWTPEGEVIDSSIPDGEPRTFSMDALLGGLAEGLGAMAKGEKRRLWIPGALATSGRPRRPGAAGPSVFDVELLDFVKTPDPIPVPDDVDAPPAEAKRTASGLAYEVLKRGKGKEHPTASSTVEVHYSGWTREGRLFDSSVSRGKSISFPLDGVIKGWTEGVQLMVVGDKTRFWIPSALAYGDAPARAGTPAGPLVFDIELLAIR